MKHFDIVLADGPNPTEPVFVDVKDDEGRSFRLGEWVRLPDGYWAIRVTGWVKLADAANFPDDSRYPYTYADDYVRGAAGYDDGGTVLSRSAASQVLEAVAEAVGIEHEQLARIVAAYAVAHKDELAERHVHAMLRSRGLEPPGRKD